MCVDGQKTLKLKFDSDAKYVIRRGAPRKAPSLLRSLMLIAISTSLVRHAA